MYKQLTIIGIDPGLSGGISILRYNQDLISTFKTGVVYNIPIEKIQVSLSNNSSKNNNNNNNKKSEKSKKNKKIKKSRVNISKLISIVSGFKNTICYLEQPQARPNQSSNSTATTFFNYGCLWTALKILDIPVKEISPLKWQKIYDVDPFKQIVSGLEGKARSIHLAKTYGINLRNKTRSQKDSDGLADAFCISIYGLIEELFGSML